MPIPTMITVLMRQRLKNRGYSDDDISKMTPTEAWGTIFTEAALALFKLGYYVFPCVPGEKRPLTEHGLKDATRDPATIRRWWHDNPMANLAVDCGRSKWVVADLDVKDGKDGPTEWYELGVDDSGTLEATTPTGGIHKVYKSNGAPIRNSVGKLAPGIDIRAEGGYILVEPSVTADGEYTWDASSHPEDMVPVQVPDRLVQLLSAENGGTSDPWDAAATAGQPAATDIPQQVPRGQRNDTLTRVAGALRRQGLTADQMFTILSDYNREHMVPPLTPPEVKSIAQSVERYPPSVGTAVQTIQLSPEIYETLVFGADDEGNAQAVNLLHGAEFAYCDAYGWLRYNGQHWDKSSGEPQLERAIVETLKDRRLAATQRQLEGVAKATRPTATNVKNCKFLFSSIASLDVSVFDQSPDLLNCQNGVLDLRTGDLYPHRPEQHFTYCIPTVYDPDADYTEWVDHITTWVNGDQQLVDYLQMAIGYSLTGHTWEECLFYLHGPTRSGKGTFTETILSVLGKEPLSTEVDFGTFTADRSNDSQNFDLAGLKPCRFVAASESSKYSQLNTPRVKALTGGNEVRCAFKHRDHFTYRPQFKIWLSSNYPPNADVDDDAVWYRLQTISFPVSFVGREDKGLKRRLKQPSSRASVLNWAVRGAIRWYNSGTDGLPVPRQVRETTDRARVDLDYVQQWIDECIEVTQVSTHFLSNASLYASYREWCLANGVPPKQMRSLTMELKRKGLDAGALRRNPGTGKVERGCYGVKAVI